MVLTPAVLSLTKTCPAGTPSSAETLNERPPPNPAAKTTTAVDRAIRNNARSNASSFDHQKPPRWPVGDECVLQTWRYARRQLRNASTRSRSTDCGIGTSASLPKILLVLRIRHHKAG